MSYLRLLEQEFGEGSNSIRIELNKFEKAGLLQSFGKGNKRYFTANIGHPLFSELQSLVRKYMGLDTVVDKIANKLGNPNRVYLAGKVAQGLDTGVIELVFVGPQIDADYLAKLAQKAEAVIGRKITFTIFTQEAFEKQTHFSQKELLLIYN
jgi:hypothetical protein